MKLELQMQKDGSRCGEEIGRASKVCPGPYRGVLCVCPWWPPALPLEPGCPLNGLGVGNQSDRNFPSQWSDLSIN